jgi:hypothetical protein
MGFLHNARLKASIVFLAFPEADVAYQSFAELDGWPLPATVARVSGADAGGVAAHFLNVSSTG